ncbi:MAG: hypothetical protein ACK56F_00840, partial [bacterium]
MQFERTDLQVSEERNKKRLAGNVHHLCNGPVGAVVAHLPVVARPHIIVPDRPLAKEGQYDDQHRDQVDPEEGPLPVGPLFRHRPNRIHDVGRTERRSLRRRRTV